ncbi:hypothetical protein N658DRAFT_209368 [Parathielavia hyrcaniae]|uniref:Uncharacterized protein n=1 Tax=Parathielavia hyrcaniae TaxID=113614 RepID=A0AAN6PVM0_9PEZI|nr:hypothetical protein N658DRAFT_209368 [Parathielavia hyrcaniae]
MSHVSMIESRRLPADLQEPASQVRQETAPAPTAKDRQKKSGVIARRSSDRPDIESVMLRGNAQENTAQAAWLCRALDLVQIWPWDRWRIGAGSASAPRLACPIAPGCPWPGCRQHKVSNGGTRRGCCLGSNGGGTESPRAAGSLAGAGSGLRG